MDRRAFFMLAGAKRHTELEYIQSDGTASIDLGLTGLTQFKGLRQLCYNGDFALGTNDWISEYSNISVTDGVLTISKTSDYSGGLAYKSISIYPRYLYFAGTAKIFDEFQFICNVGTFLEIAQSNVVEFNTTEFERKSALVLQRSFDKFGCRSGYAATAIGATAYFKNVVLFDLNGMFGSTLPCSTNLEFEDMFGTDYYPYDENGRYYPFYSADGLHEFIPVEKNDGTLAMFDKSTGNYYYFTGNVSKPV